MDFKTKEPDIAIHPLLHEIIRSFQQIMWAHLWLMETVDSAIDFYDESICKNGSPPFGIQNGDDGFFTFPRENLDIMQREKLLRELGTPEFSRVQKYIFRSFIVTLYEIILSLQSGEDESYKDILNSDLVKFLKFLRNGSSHNNEFYFDKGKPRKKVLKKLPLIWRDLKITEELEGSEVLFSFFKPGHYPLLLKDISDLLYSCEIEC